MPPAGRPSQANPGERSPQPGSSRRRIGRACDTCHKRGRRCRPADEYDSSPTVPCLTCQELGLRCTRTRIVARRGPKPGQRPSSQDDKTAREPSRGLRGSAPKTNPHSEPVLRFLMTSFFDNVYPVANYVYEKSFVDTWVPGSEIRHGSKYARLMAMCALSACRAKQGSDPVAFDSLENIDPDYYLNEALDATRSKTASSRDIESLQAVGLICMTALEVGRASLLHEYLGLYHTVVAEQGLWDERRWPAGISAVEREERRRLFWHMYRLEVHMSMIMGHAVRCPELQAMVLYPTMTELEGSGDLNSPEWLSGWNFVTDLYRALEHLLTSSRIRLFPAIHTQQRGNLSTVFLIDHDLDERILEPLALVYDNLPERFTQAPAMSLNKARNRCGFQTANIICTYQLVKMVSYTSTADSLHHACRTAHDLIDQITSIPIEYLRAMSLAMMQELSGFGYILSNFMKAELSESDYHILKTAILCMAEFLESLKSNMSEATRTSQRFRAYASRIDELVERSRSSARDIDGEKLTPGPAIIGHDEWNAALALENGIFWGDVRGMPFDME